MPSRSHPAPEAGEGLRCRIHGPESLPVVIFLPGIHGDWTLIGRLRTRLAGLVRWVEFTYPRDPTWTLEDYARGIRSALRDAGIRRGWALAESFGSQVAWPWLADPSEFRAEGLILAGGFGSYPFPRLLQLGDWVARQLGPSTLRPLLRAYCGIARTRIGPDPLLRSDLEECLRRRTPADWAAMRHRLTLIAASHPEPLAAQVHCPTFYLAGLIDPIVPWPTVPAWLRRHCPGFAGWRIVPLSDHAVLVNAASASASWMRRWMARPEPRDQERSSDSQNATPS